VNEMIEVEVRSKVEDFSQLKKELSHIGARFVKSERQVDRMFAHPAFMDKEDKPIDGGFVARMREIDDKTSFEFKEIIRKGGGIELQSELSDLDAGLRLLEKTGWKEGFIVSKIREIYKYKDFEIALDTVEKLGKYIEIEMMVDSKDKKDAARAECAALLNELSPGSVIEHRKYGDMMQDTKNKEDK